MIGYLDEVSCFGELKLGCDVFIMLSCSSRRDLVGGDLSRYRSKNLEYILSAIAPLELNASSISLVLSSISCFKPSLIRGDLLVIEGLLDC